MQTVILPLSSNLSDISAGSCYARNVLSFFYGYEYWEEPEFELEPRLASAEPPLVKNEDQMVLVVYPNPAETHFNFKYEDSKEVILIEIYDMLGRLIYSKETLDGYLQVKIDTWPKGLYVFRGIRNGILVECGKVIVK